jgi:hypothetical protein
VELAPPATTILFRELTGNRLPRKAPVKAKISPVHSVHEGILQEFTHPNDARVCEVHPLIGVLPQQSVDGGHFFIQVKSQP